MEINRLTYFDFSTPLLGGRGGKKSQINLKIPVETVHDLYYYIETILKLDLSILHEVHQYELVKSRGYTYLQFKRKRIIDGQELWNSIQNYKKVKSRKY